MYVFSKFKSWSRASLLLAAGASLVAQESGQISGVVKGPDGKPIPGASVTVRAPQLIQQRTVPTSADGTYRVPLLPPGDYRITATAPGYMGASADLRIGIGTRLTQDFPLKAVPVATQTIEVVASSVVADKTDTKSSTNFSAAQLELLPTDRAFYGAADLAPGVVTTVTGSLAVRGGKTQSTVYTLNGVSIGDDYQGQQYENRIVDDAIEDVQVIQSPLNARYGRTGGGIINVVSKSGGNEFTGSIRANLGRDDWRTWRPHRREQETTSSNYSGRKYEIFFAGPIVKDRVWFAVNTVKQPPQTNNDTLLQGEDTSVWGAGFSFGPGDLNAVFGVDEVPFVYDMGETLTVSTTIDQINAKLTFAIGADHTLEYEYYKREDKTSNRNPYGVPIVATIQSNSLSQVGESKTHSLLYRGTFSSNVFVEGRFSKLTSETMFPYPPLDHVRWQNSGSQLGVFFPYGFNLSPAPDARNNQSGQINVKIFAEAMGSHEIDTGIDYYEFQRGTQTQNGALNRRFYVMWATPGSVANAAGNLPQTSGFGPVGTDPYGNSVGFFAMNFLDQIGIFGGQPGLNGVAPVYQQFYGKDGKTKNTTKSIYVNDQWTLNQNWNLMLGLRLDRMSVTDTDGVKLLDKTAPISPRLQLRYDLNGDAVRVFTFTAAKYVEDFRAGFTDAFVKKANSKFARFGWSAFNTDDYGFVSYANLINPANYGGPKGGGPVGVAGAPYQVADPTVGTLGVGDITNPYTMEFTLGYRRNYKNGSSISVNYVHKDWKNDFAVTQDFDNSYRVLASDPSGKSTAQVPVFAVRYGNSDLLKRQYNALEFEFVGRLSTMWTVTGSYTYSRLTGNTEGGDSTSQGFRDNTASQPLYLRNWLTTPATGFVGGAYGVSDFAPEGPLSSDRPHKLRVSVTARIPMGKGFVSYGLIGSYNSGSAYSAIQTNSTQNALFLFSPTTPRPTLPSTFNRYYSGRGAFRNNDSYGVDFKMAFHAPIVAKLQLIGDFSIINIFNDFLQTGWDRTFTATGSTTRTNPITVASRNAFGTDAGLNTNYSGTRSFSATLGLRF